MRIVLALLSLVPFAPAHLGSGDDVQPRDTVSVIRSVSPALPDGVRISIVGGDTFVRIESDGVPVEVHGYDDEQYLRISAAGKVEVNLNSTTAVLNQDRYGTAAGGDATAPHDTPRWTVTATDGVAMWHDHRVHWMSPTGPVAVDDTGMVQEWAVPVIAGGTRVLVSGTLYLRDRAPFAWWMFAPVAALVVALLARSRRTRYVAVPVVAVVGALVGWMQWTGLPAGARITPLLMVFSAGAMVLGAGAWLARRNTHVADSVNAGAAAALVIAAWMNAAQVRSAYVPGLDTAWPGRVAVALLMGAGIAAVIDGVARIVRG